MNLNSNLKTYLKYMKNLLGIIGAGDNCILISQAEDSGSSTMGQSAAAGQVSASLAVSGARQHQVQYAIVLCNSIGTPLEYKYIDFQPQFWSMNATHVLVASKSYFYLWNYQSMVDRNSIKKQTSEKLVFIDNPNVSVQMKSDDSAIVAIGPSLQESKNPIVCITVSDKYFFIARQSGFIQKFSLATAGIVEVHLNESNGVIASKISINSNST